MLGLGISHLDFFMTFLCDSLFLDFRYLVGAMPIHACRKPNYFLRITERREGTFKVQNSIKCSLSIREELAHFVACAFGLRPLGAETAIVS